MMGGILTSNRNANGEEVTVILFNSQGMFDHETAMTLSTSILGLATLLIMNGIPMSIPDSPLDISIIIFLFSLFTGIKRFE